MQKVLLSASLLIAVFTLSGTSVRTQPIPGLPQAGQQSQQTTKSIAGTVTSIGDKGLSFAVAVDDGKEKKTLQFVVDEDTQIQGQVKVGTPVMVE